MAGPSIASLTTSRGKPGDRVEIAGTSFGQGKTGSEVRLRLRVATGAVTAAAPVENWNEKKIRFRVPAVAALGSGGIADLWVHTPAGESKMVEFTVLEPAAPVNAGVMPAEQLAAHEITVTGTGFGLAPFDTAAVVIDAPGGPAADPVEWTPTRIRATLPPASVLGAPGPRRIRVRTLWGETADRTIVVGAAPEVTTAFAPGRPDEPAAFLP